jgi:hypothetical protein
MLIVETISCIVFSLNGFLLALSLETIISATGRQGQITQSEITINHVDCKPSGGHFSRLED